MPHWASQCMTWAIYAHFEQIVGKEMNGEILHYWSEPLEGTTGDSHSDIGCSGHFILHTVFCKIFLMVVICAKRNSREFYACVWHRSASKKETDIQMDMPRITVITAYSKGFACTAGPGTVLLYERTEEREGYRKTRKITVMFVYWLVGWLLCAW